ncbi:hypothetical protein JRO89_XS05G0232100 [Xanthoceras sorbifolium]|uniref:Uncharacterized protein n=1 Tax=Xanthoceras sorbifolium TaxID=99658 RepID=A0ABQ8I3J9_9ROSI|nr:hypothetical protein JRO89_XS05G0231700 [Xanthoceras sorbifolium]KAH7570972.1 hypothetical protein JRO89_XS05G0232100 [Xanthoceras sorbifolium]
MDSLEVLSLVFALLHHDQEGSKAPSPHQTTIKSPPSRKARFFHSDESFHAPPTSAQLLEREANSNNPDNSLYEDDKRIIHTGPNPLHN